MRRQIRFSLAGIVMLLAAATVASAQDNAQSQAGQDSASSPAQTARKTVSPRHTDDSGRYVVSANAGLINTAEGDVTFKRGDEDWKPVVSGDQLKSADQIRTGSDGMAEVLLTPGSYLRLASNTTVKMDNASLDDLRMSVLAGSVIVEVASFDKTDRVLGKLSMPNGTFPIMHRGVYRFNVSSSGAETVEVEKGKLAVGGKEIGEGKIASIDSSGSSTDVQTLSKSSRDVFDNWSQERAQALVDANGNLQSPTPAAPAYAPGGLYGPGYNPWFGYNPWLPGFTSFYDAQFAGPPLFGGLGCAGSWYFSPFFGGYTYLPGYFDYDFFGNGYPCWGGLSGYGFRYPIRGIFRRPGEHLVKLPLGTIVSRKDGREPGVRVGANGSRFGGAYRASSGSAGHSSSGSAGHASSGSSGGGHSSGGGGGGGHR